MEDGLWVASALALVGLQSVRQGESQLVRAIVMTCRRTKGMFTPIALAAALMSGVPGLGAGGEKKKEANNYLPAGPGHEPFDVTRHAVPLEEIQGGGPPKDGIPALRNPRFVDAESAGKFLRWGDRVLGIAFGGQARAYPLKILNWHELVNDSVAGKPILASW